MKVMSVIVMCLMLIGCPFGYDVSLSNTQYVILESSNMFVVNSLAYTRLRAQLPVGVYNPNIYDIEVNGVIIESHTTHTFNIED